jgi:hypothetical protein
MKEGKRVFVCGSRAVTHEPKGEKHGAFFVRGATSGNIIKRFPYDERPRYSEAWVRSCEGSPEQTPQAWAKLLAEIRGKTMQEAKDAACARAVATSAVVTATDR